jgi:hypothetical protein
MASFPMASSASTCMPACDGTGIQNIGTFASVSSVQQHPSTAPHVALVPAPPPRPVLLACKPKCGSRAPELPSKTTDGKFTCIECQNAGSPLCSSNACKHCEDPEHCPKHSDADYLRLATIPRKEKAPRKRGSGGESGSHSWH